MNTGVVGVLPVLNHFTFMKDFSMHLSMVGFKDSLLVQVKGKYLKDLISLIFCPSIHIGGIVTCEKKICAPVLLTFIISVRSRRSD